MSRIVVTGRIPDAAIEKLRLEHEVDAWPGPESISPEELLRRVAGAEAILSLLTERVDGELLDAAGPQLKVVANVAVGYDNIDVAAGRERGVVATNTPGVLTQATADIAFGLLLMATRRLGEGERIIRAGQAWKWGMFFLLGSGLQGKTLGVVGMGGIGQATARAPRPSAWTSTTSRAARSIPTSRPSWARGGSSSTSCWPSPMSSRCTAPTGRPRIT